MSYSFPGVPGLAAGGSGDNEKEREVRISSLIPMGSTNMVRINIHIVQIQINYYYLLILNACKCNHTILCSSVLKLVALRQV